MTAYFDSPHQNGGKHPVSGIQMDLARNKNSKQLSKTEISWLHYEKYTENPF